MSITDHILSRALPDRLQGGIEGLTSGAYHITIHIVTDHEITGTVTNGDGNAYSVSLTAMKAVCECRDSQFRQKTCKHAVAVALHVVREGLTPTWGAPRTEPNLKLAKVRRSSL